MYQERESKVTGKSRVKFAPRAKRDFLATFSLPRAIYYFLSCLGEKDVFQFWLAGDKYVLLASGEKKNIYLPFEIKNISNSKISRKI